MKKVLFAVQSALGVRSFGCRNQPLGWRWYYYHNV